jgi:signal transduction histidine kinase
VVTGAPARRRVEPAAAAAAVAVVAAVVAGVATLALLDRRLAGIGRTDLRQSDAAGMVLAVTAASSAAVGAVLLLRRPRHPVGWCFAALAGSIALTAGTTAYGVWGTLARPGSLPGAPVAALAASVAFIQWNTVVGLICYLTPTGRSLSPRWAWCARALVGSAVLWTAAAALSAQPFDPPFETVPNPWAIAGVQAWVDPVRTAGAVANTALVFAGAASLVVRFRRAVGDERRQLLWMAVAAVPVPVFLGITFAAAVADRDELVAVAVGGYLAVLPVAAALAIVKYRLYDVDRILSRTVAYVLVSAVLAAGYALVAVLVAQGVGGLARGSGLAAALAALAVVTAARPVYAAVQDAVDRRFARRRFEALRVVQRYVAAPSADRSPEQVLRDALGDPALAVGYWVPDRERWVTGAGHPATPPADAVPVERGGRTIARVRADPDRADAGLVRAVLRAMAPELDNAGLRAAVSLQLEEVRASRARITAAQLEERRRIERDLHDGAQQRLLALAAQLQAALLNGDPDRMRAALATGVAESRTVVRELRELANGLHPAVLSDGGLAAALDRLATGLPVRVHVAAPERRYPPPVEGTAWFVACEAVANALKHADAGRIDVTVHDGAGELHVVVTDDGHGGADPAGRGLRGLADRVEAVGGRLELGAGTGARGTTVRAVLPCG